MGVHRKMKRINFPLLLGSVIVVILILVSFYPGIFTSNDPLFEESAKYIEYKYDGQLVEEFAYNPIRPNLENKMGTDDAGRDVYARLVYGTRNTMKLAVLVGVMRMLLALPLGMAAGMGIHIVSMFINLINTYFTAIPMLIFSYIILNIGYFRRLQMDRAIWAFAIVLTLVGWAKLAGIIEDNTRRIMGEDFIEGEIAIGKTKFQIAYQNVFPHIIPSSISLFFKELGMALFLIAQLAVLSVFVGFTRHPKAMSFKANYDMILEPEWGGTLSRIALNLKKYDRVYWMTFYPILVFTLAIIGINLTGEGLRVEFGKRDSRFISNIRKIYYVISPKTFFSQIKDIKRYYKPIMIKSIILIGILLYIVIPWNPSDYNFEISNAKMHLEELTDAKYMGRVPGTEGGYEAGNYIINELESYGYIVDTIEIPLTSPVDELDSDIEMPKLMAPLVIDKGQIKLKSKDGDEKTYYLDKDFSILAVNSRLFLDRNRTEIKYQGSISSKDEVDNFKEDENVFLIGTGYPPYTYGYNVNQIKSVDEKTLKYDVQFYINDQEQLPERINNTYAYNATSILPFDEMENAIMSGYNEAEIVFDYPQMPKYPARNITAFLPGVGRSLEDKGEVLIIGSMYDGAKIVNGKTHAMTATPAATALEVARILKTLDKPLEKSIEFIFWDNQHDNLKYTELDGTYYYNRILGAPIDMALKHGYYYYDIAYPGIKDSKEYLNLITFPAQRADKSSYLMGLNMEKRLKEMDIKYRRFFSGYSTTMATRHMRLNALTTVGLGSTNTEFLNTDIDNLDNINYKKIEQIGQIMVDTITMNPYTMQ